MCAVNLLAGVLDAIGNAKAHISSLYRKLGPQNRVELALLARHHRVRVAER